MNVSNIDSHSLVASKENIQPLRKGRDTSQLCAALQAETDTETHQALEKQRNEFEIRLRSQTSDDPLAAWCDYINWIEQSFPKQPREGKLNVVLQKCLNKFKDSEQYMNDLRFVKLCIKYADLEENTVELFSQIHRHGIGVQCAQLYIAWAEKYALLDCFKKANAVYEKGLQCRAQPLESLEQAHKNFLAAVALKMLNKKESSQQPEPTPQPNENRHCYNVLTSVSMGTKTVVPSVRVGANVLGEPGKLKQSVVKDSKPKSNTGITIYQDNENDIPTAEPKAKLDKIQSKKTLTKENTVKAGAWTDKKKPVPFTVPAPVSVPFQVHVDEDSVDTTPRPQSITSSVLKSHKVKKGYEDENFANAPLFYLEPYDPSKKPMYCKELVYAGGLEFQFEELRAIQYRKKKEEEMIKKAAEESKPELKESEPVQESKEPERVPVTEVKEPERVPVPESTQKERIPLSKPESQVKSKSERKKKSDDEKRVSESKRKTLFAKVKPIEKVVEEPVPPTDFSINQTINTKEALSEMQQLWFSKPASPLLNVNPPEKHIGKSILKKDKPSFNLYVDESCLGNFNGKNQEEEKPLDLTMKSNSNSDIQIPMDCEKPRCSIQIFKDVDNSENIIRKKPESERKLKLQDRESEEVFGVIKKNILKPLDDEDKENDIPNDYCGPTGKSERKTTGILTPAENVPFTPLSDVEEEDDDRDDIDGDFSAIIQCNMTGITETINFTRAFQNPRNESTPNPRKCFHNKPDFNESVFVPESNDDQPQPPRAHQPPTEPRRFTIFSENNALESRKTPPRKDENYKNLSVIAETSREYKSSSSGSSGVSTFALRPSQKFPYTPSESTRNTKFSITSTSHLTLQKTKGLSMYGYEASNEFSHTTGFRHTETNEVNVEKFISLNESNETTNKNEVEAIDQQMSNVQIQEEIDPFSEELIEKLLEAVDFPNDKHRSCCFAMGDVKVGVPKVGGNLVLGEDSYEVKKILGEGAYAKIFKIVNEENGKQMIAKYQKPAFPWEFYITKEVQTRLKNKNLASLFMNVESAYFFQNASILLTKPVEYGDLLSAINKMKQGQIMCQLIAMYFTVEILTILETLHSLKIIHGDIKPDNFLLTGDTKKPRLQLIDFGRAIDMSLFPEKTTFKRVVTTEGFTTIEMQTGKPWTYQIDLYGAANCGHCLLFGDYMKVAETHGIWNISKIIPRYWARTEWKNFFTTLLNIESCFNLPDLTKLKEPFLNILSDESELDFSISKLVNLLKNR